VRLDLRDHFHLSEGSTDGKTERPVQIKSKIICTIGKLHLICLGKAIDLLD
jgi:hypothetical protein